jgi:putative tricarboxylic transport membrane protein
MKKESLVQERIVSALFFVFALVVMRGSFILSLGEVRNPGPGFVPFFLGLVIAMLSIFCFFLPDKDAEIWFQLNGWEGEKTIFSILVGLVVYLLLVHALGFFIGTFILLVYIIKLAGEKGYTRNLTVSSLTVITLYVIFYKLLGIPFPMGILRM